MKNPRSVTHCGHDVISRGGGEGSIGESPIACRRRSPRHADTLTCDVCGCRGGVKCGLVGLSLPLHDRPIFRAPPGLPSSAGETLQR
jgi:hypothetical protein